LVPVGPELPIFELRFSDFNARGRLLACAGPAFLPALFMTVIVEDDCDNAVLGIALGQEPHGAGAFGIEKLGGRLGG